MMLTSCGSNSPQSTCDAFTAKLRSCGLIASDAKPACTEPPTGYFECIGNCRASASCSELKLFVCHTEKTGALDTCENACEDATPNFTCANGETIKDYFVCDNFKSCSDGSDEASCPTFTCADGNVIHASLRCDGQPDCNDSSDEAGCPTFTCKNGVLISAVNQCDGRWNCTDGSDEASCPPQVRDILTCN